MITKLPSNSCAATGRSTTRKPRTTQQQQHNAMTSNGRKDRYRSSSPFGNAVKTPQKSGSIMRTRSLDDHHHQEQLEQNNYNPPLSQEDIEMTRNSTYYEGGSASSCCNDDKDEGTTVATALHSSFDVSQLRGAGGASCSSGDITLFESGFDEDEGDSEVIIDARNTSFGRGDPPSTGKNDNNHHRYYQPRQPKSISGKEVSYADLKPPSTIRKTKLSLKSRKDRRRSGDTATTAATFASSMSTSPFALSMPKTPARTPGGPLRHVHGISTHAHARTPGKSAGLHKSPAPSSTAKRRRDPFVHPARLSPMRRDTAAANTPTSFLTAPPFGLLRPAASASKSGEGDNSDSLSTQTPIHQNLSSDTHGSFLKNLPYHTGTTTATAPLETTIEVDGDSVETSSPARFRFTSFPASLPRVQNASHYPRTTPPVCPGSIRKRMSFDTEEETVIADRAKKLGQGEHEDRYNDNDPVGLNYSIHDAVDHSKDDDGTHNTSLSSLSVEGGHHQHLPHLPHQHPPHFATVPMKNLLLHPGERDFLRYSDDDEDDLASKYVDEGIATSASPDQEGTVRRTRLNFNDLSPSSNEKKIANNSEENDFGSERRINQMPNVDLSRPYDTQNRINSFPSSLSSHTQINASTHINEDNLMVGAPSSSMSPPRVSIVQNSNSINNLKTPHEVHLHFPLESECSPILGGHKHDFVEAPTCSNTVILDRQQLETISYVPKTNISSLLHQATKHVSHQKDEGNSSISSSSESTTTTQKRRFRPMPDMSAFENVKMPSTRTADRPVDDSTTTGDSWGMGSLTRRERACPPTPQRTPAWANEGGSHAIFKKQNSLIMTKVLLSCPSQVLEGRSSLETSVLDEESKHGSRRNSLSNSYDSTANRSTEEATNLPGSLTHEDENMTMDVDKCEHTLGLAGASTSNTHEERKLSHDQIAAPPKLMRRLPSNPNNNSVISFAEDFEILGSLGSGAFADVYKVRQKSDDHLYAIKRNRRQFRGKRDRDVALAEVQSMQRLQSVFATNNASREMNHPGHSSNSSSDNKKNCYSLYLLFFYRAWQEDGYFYSQTELCCRDTCRELLDSLRFLWNSAKKKYPSLVKKLPPPAGVEAGSHQDAFGRLVPNMTVWKMCHDISAGLSHIHSHGIVHQDIKPSNIFLVTNARFGAMCKIGDFGLAGGIGSSGDGQEGDTRYMPPELLASATRHTSSDIFSLGLTLYEIATDRPIDMPSEGPQWHQLRSSEEPKLPACRGDDLQYLLQSMTDPDERKRPPADAILENTTVKVAGHNVDTFLQDYIRDVEAFDRQQEERLAMDRADDQTPRNDHRSATVRSPSLSMLLPGAPSLFSPPAKVIHS